MKRTSRVVCITILMGCLLSVNGNGEEGTKLRTDRTARGRTPTSGINMASSKRSHRAVAVFRGKVLEVKLSSRIIVIRDGENTVRFDASNPVFSGYRSLSDVKACDVIALSYTTKALKVTKVEGKAACPPGGMPDLSPRKKDVKGLYRRPKQDDVGSFDGADVNKDGRLTPIELSVIIPDLTMDKFRQYDKKGQGFLDMEEFDEIMRSRAR